MIYEGTMEDEVIDILSKKYVVKPIDDESLELEDETHFCLELHSKDGDIHISDIEVMVKGVTSRVIKYGHLYGFSI